MSASRMIKMLGLAVVAALALSAVAAASASAYTFQPEEYPVLFTGTSGAGKLYTLEHGEIKCKADDVHGYINSKDTVSKVLVTFLGCEEPALGAKCGNVTSENIETVDMHGWLVELLNEKPGLALLAEGSTAGAGTIATFKCVGFLGIEATLKVRGVVVGEFTGEYEKQGTKFTLDFAAPKEMQAQTSFTYLGTVYENQFLETESKGAASFGWTPSAEETLEEVTTAKEGHIEP